MNQQSEIDFLEKIRAIINDTPSIQLKRGVSDADLIATKHLIREINFDGANFFYRKNQQMVPNIHREIFLALRQNNLLSTLSAGKFGFTQNSKLSAARIEGAKEKTKEVLKNYFQSQGYVFKGYRHTQENEDIIISQIIHSGFVAEKGKDGFQLRQLKELGEFGAKYWSKPFPADQVVDKFVKPYIDQEATEIKNLERMAAIKEKAEKLSFGNKASAERLEKALLKQNQVNTLYTVPHSDIPNDFDLKSEIENLEIWKIGYPDKGLAALSELRGIAKAVEDHIENINKPTFKEFDPQTQERLTRYDEIVISNY